MTQQEASECYNMLFVSFQDLPAFRTHVQLSQQPNRLVVSAHEVSLNLVECVVDVNAPQLIIPAVFGR